MYLFCVLIEQFFISIAQINWVLLQF